MTKLSVNVRIPLIVVSAKSFVSHALKTVGIESRTFGHWNHKIQAFFLENVLIPILGQNISKFAFLFTKILRFYYYRKNNIRDIV